MINLAQTSATAPKKNPALAAIQKRRAGADVATRIIINDDQMTIARTQDCTPIAEYAVAQHNAGYHGSAEMKHAARIPNVIIEKYCNEQGITFEEFIVDPVHIKRVVKHPDNSMFRIWKGNF